QPLLATRAEGAEDLLVPDAVDERLDGDLELAAIDPEAGHGPAGTGGFEAPLERLGLAERLDRDVDATPAGEALDRGDRVFLGEVDHLCGAHLARKVQPFLD